MVEVQIYTRPYCGYCRAAKALLDDKRIAYKEMNASDPAIRQDMIQRSSGGTTVPQIFFGNVHVGGYTELAQLKRDNRLDELLEEKTNGLAG